MWSLAQLVPSFIVPGLAIAGAAAVSVPVIIHILSKRPRKPEPWAAMRFLLAAYRKHRMRTRLEQWVLLAMRCLLLVLLGMALAGPIWAAASGMAGLGGGRTVVLVLDNSVTSGAADEPGHSRLATLQEAADKLLESLGPGDRAALITAARPATAVIAPPTADPAAVRNQVRQVRPNPAAADLAEALVAARQSLRDSDEAPGGGGGRTYIVLLSDFSAGATGSRGAGESAGLARELAGLGDTAVLLRNEPLPASANVQIAGFEPEQRVVIPDAPGQKPTVTWSLLLRRQEIGEAPAAATTVRLTLLNSQPILRTVSWEAGQRELELRISTSLDEPGLITAQASLEPMTDGADALATDNVRHALVGVRQKVTVMLVGAGGSPEAQGPFTPERWLRTALAPVSDQLGWPIDVRTVDAPSVGTAAVELNEADAVIILRPDQLADEGFTALRNWAEAGGLACFVAPAVPRGEASQLWPQKLADAFNLPWSVGQEVVEYDEESPLRLQTDSPPTGELRRLSADLPDLLGPIQVFRRLPVDPTSLRFGADPLLAGTGGEPILIGATTESGRGRVLLLATAIDTEWTNLPAKPLIVPLLHEALRAAIDRVQPQQNYEPGDQPALGGTWERAVRITAPDGEPVLLTREGDEQGPVRPIRPFEQLGVYLSETDALVVNVNPDAADTRDADRAALDALLGAAGQWRTLSLGEPAAAMAVPAEKADLSWPLLWVVLALAIAETLFARAVSHAGVADRTVNVMETRRAA